MKSLLKKIIKKFGFQISRIQAKKTPLDFLKTNLIPEIIFDVGAHQGETALIYHGLFPKSKIYSFEPFNESFNILNDIAQNRPRIIPINLGLSNKKGTLDFNVNQGSPTNSIFKFSNQASQTWGISLQNKSLTKIKFTTLDEFCLKNKIEKIDLLKVDVQGAEYLVLMGSEDFIKKKLIKSILIEIIIGDTYENQKSIGYYLNYMEKYDYKLVGFYDLTYNSENKLIQLDALFTL